MPEFKPARFRRMLAWFLDMGICLMLPARLVTVLPLSANVQIFAAAFAIFGGFAAFLCRDYLLGGRSIGKRILGLSVVDRQTGEAVTGGRLVLRNLFFFLYPVDGGFLLFSGRSLGERTTNTRVIRARNRCEVRVKPFLIVGGIAAAIALAFSGLIFGVMKLVQSTEGYAVCYDYLVESEAFAAQGAEEDRIGMTGFSQNTTFQNGLPVTTATYTFNVDGVSYAITCHPGEDGWAVCEECTGFD